MKLFKLLIIPLVLALGYLTLVLYPYFLSKITRFDSLGHLSLVEEQSVNIQKTFSPERRTDQFDNHLLKGEKVTVKLKASENNFGILLFRFAQLSGNATDTVVFRIKEEGSANWYYEQKYKADQFQPDQYFTFGFPPILNSRDRVYVFEIESLSGTYKNGIGLSAKEPKVALVYKYSREDLKNLDTLSSFVFKKFVYATANADFLGTWQLLATPLLAFLFILFIKKKKIVVSGKIIPKFKKFKNNHFIVRIFHEQSFKQTVRKIMSICLLQKKKNIHFFNQIVYRFTSAKIYLYFLNTNTKKRIAISLLIFLIAFLYRYSVTLIDQLGVSLFYAGLGGQGDYDQFIRAATCALKLCPAILGQNFLIESSILGIFYEIFGFAGGLRAYLYLMLILSSLVATFPYILLSRKHFLTIGGIIGGLFLATSDFLTYVALNLPPDNGSLFTFSMFFLVYLLTIHIGTIRWLLFFGLMGTIDGLNKLIILINDLAAFMLFIPVFIYEKTNRIGKFPFFKLNPKLIFYSILPLLVFLVLYSGWEYIVQIKFSTPYYLRALIEGGSTYASSTIQASTSINESLSRGNILGKSYYYAGLSIVMIKRLTDNAGLNDVLLTPILLGLVFVTFRNAKYFFAKLITIIIFAILAFTTIVLFRNNYLSIQEVGQYVYAWSNDIYVNVFLFASIIFLFILNFRYQAFKLALPIIPYVIMLIVLAKNAPEVRLLVHVIAWSVILFSFLIDWILTEPPNSPGSPSGAWGGKNSGWKRNDKKNILKRLWIGPVILILFISFYTVPKLSTMVGKLAKGYSNNRNEVKYLKWVNLELPENAIILAGGESDLVSVAQELKRPIIYNTLWAAALLIKPNEIPRVKPTDFAILDQLDITEMRGITPSDFSIIEELKNKDNFAKNKYLILEDDINIWRNRMAGVADNVFATDSGALLHADDYLIKVYKSNSALNKGIYELTFTHN